MPIRFSTEAANADVLGDDADSSGGPGAMPQAGGGDGRGRPHFSRSTPRGSSPAEAPTGEARRGKDEAKPGKDINAAGFVKDKDSS
jgi:hypothetical protein